MLPLFFLSMQVLTYVMQYFGGDPGAAVMVDGKETYPAGSGRRSASIRPPSTSSTRLLLFPFVGVFERYLSRIGHTEAEEMEDYSTPKYLDRSYLRRSAEGGAGGPEGDAARSARLAPCSSTSRAAPRSAPKDPGEHFAAVDILNRDIRSYSASLFKQDMPYDQLDLVASLIEEADFTASLAEALHQVARRVKREKFGQQGQEVIDAALAKLEHSMRAIMPNGGFEAPMMPAGHVQNPEVEELRMRTLNTGPGITSAERGAILAILGSVERAELLVRRIDAERKSVNRAGVLAKINAAAASSARTGPRRAGAGEPSVVACRIRLASPFPAQSARSERFRMTMRGAS